MRKREHEKLERDINKLGGWTENTRQRGFHQPTKKWGQRCPYCNGTGRTYWKKWQTCKRCEGAGGTD